jgi:hypothetical protein
MPHLHGVTSQMAVLSTVTPVRLPGLMHQERSIYTTAKCWSVRP